MNILVHWLHITVTESQKLKQLALENVGNKKQTTESTLAHIFCQGCPHTGIHWTPSVKFAVNKDHCFGKVSVSLVHSGRTYSFSVQGKGEGGKASHISTPPLTQKLCWINRVCWEAHIWEFNCLWEFQTTGARPFLFWDKAASTRFLDSNAVDSTCKQAATDLLFWFLSSTLRTQASHIKYSFKIARSKTQLYSQDVRLSGTDCVHCDLKEGLCTARGRLCVYPRTDTTISLRCV